MSKREAEEIKRDFKKFLLADEKPPPCVSEHILLGIQADLRYSFNLILFKIFAIHAAAGFLTLSFCPQFDFSLTNNYRLFHFLHYQFGEKMCIAICGIIFLGSGSILVSFILSRSETELIDRRVFRFYPAITFVALLVFYLSGVDVTLSASFYWALGAAFGGATIFRLIRGLRILVV